MEEQARSNEWPAIDEDNEEVFIEKSKQEPQDLIARSPTPEHDLEWQDQEDFHGEAVGDGRTRRAPLHSLSVLCSLLTAGCS